MIKTCAIKEIKNCMHKHSVSRVAMNVDITSVFSNPDSASENDDCQVLKVTLKSHQEKAKASYYHQLGYKLLDQQQFIECTGKSQVAQGFPIKRNKVFQI